MIDFAYQTPARVRVCRCVAGYVAGCVAGGVQVLVRGAVAGGWRRRRRGQCGGAAAGPVRRVLGRLQRQAVPVMELRTCEAAVMLYNKHGMWASV